MTPGASSSAASPAWDPSPTRWSRSTAGATASGLGSGSPPAIVGLAIAIVIAVAGSAILRSAPENIHPRARRERRSFVKARCSRSRTTVVTLVATDPATGHQRVLHRCADCHRRWQSEEVRPLIRRRLDRLRNVRCGGGAMRHRPDGAGVWVVGADGPPIRVTSSGIDRPGWMGLGLVPHDGTARVRDRTLGPRRARAARSSNG